MADFTAQQRRTLAARGQARPDGSYPIRNTADLKNAISAYGRGANLPAVKAHIKKRAVQLGATSMLPEGW
jgi:hypothetical protein